MDTFIPNRTWNLETLVSLELTSPEQHVLLFHISPTQKKKIKPPYASSFYNLHNAWKINIKINGYNSYIYIWITTFLKASIVDRRLVSLVGKEPV